MDHLSRISTTSTHDKCPELSEQLGLGGVQPDFRGTVLIADDDAIVRLVLEEMLIRLARASANRLHDLEDPEFSGSRL